MLHTRLCDQLGMEWPIVSAPMGPDIAGPELVAAVSNAGGLGLLHAQLAPPPVFREAIRRVRELTDRPFGVGLLLPFPYEENLAVCLEEEVPVIEFFWGDPKPLVRRIHDAGTRVMVQVGSVQDAERAATAGVDFIIAQGTEAGGHVAGEVSTMVLVPRVVDAVDPVPVIASGGIADGRSLLAALSLGADGVLVGTRFLVCRESRAHPLYKERVLAASEEDTVRTILYGGGWPRAPHRCLKTPFVREWMTRGNVPEDPGPDEPVIGEREIGGQRVPIQRFSVMPPDETASGEVEAMSLLAGQCCGLVADAPSAGDVVREMVSRAKRLLADRFGAPSEPLR